MEHIVFFTEYCKVMLITDSPVSSHNIPVMRVSFAEAKVNGLEPEIDYGPKDDLPNGPFAAEVCCQTYHLQDEETQTASRAFCAQWPDGPQPGKET